MHSSSLPSAPSGEPSAEELRALLAHQDEIIAILQRQASARTRDLLDLQAIAARQRDEIHALQQAAARREERQGPRPDSNGTADSSAADLERLLIERDRMIAERDRIIADVNRSLSWRITAPLRWLRRLLSGVPTPPPRSNRPDCLPIKDLAPVNGSSNEWETTTQDPQFEVKPPWPRVTSRVTLHIEPRDGSKGRSRLYVDRGSGFTEKDSYDLGETGRRNIHYVLLGYDVVALRLDPTERPGRFVLREFTIEPSHRLMHLAARFLRRCRRAVAWRLEAWRDRRRSRRPAPTSPSGFRPPPPLDPYQAWLEVNAWNRRREELLRARLSRLPSPPLLSIVMPVYNPPLEFLENALESVSRQVYPRWELCMADDASTAPGVRRALERWQSRDPRIRVTFRTENGNISRATATAAGMARGEYLVLMDQDDELTPDALGEIAVFLSESPDCDLLYSDDDKIDAAGRRFAPQFKPDWSPELLLSYMYLSHVLVVRKELFEAVGGMRVGFEGSQDYDFALRATERARRVAHLQKVLYHWRVLPQSTASSGAAKPQSFEAGRRAVQEALERRSVSAQIHQPGWALQAGCGIFTQRFPNEGSRVAILIPSRNRRDILEPCVRSIEEKTTYRNYRIVLVDNGSDDPDTLEYFRNSPHRVLRIPSPGGKFSFAAVMNEAVQQVEDEFVLLLNNDTQVRTPEWLSQMVGVLGLPGVGAVGARLLFPDGRVQHAGILHGLYRGLAGPAFKLQPSGDSGYLSYGSVLRNYSAVTAACLLTRRSTFLDLGGFDEETFAVAYNDVDFCYRLEARGARVAYCPSAELVHHEGYSRGLGDAPMEPAAFRHKYRGRRDRHYNANLSLDDERFAIRAGTVAPADLPPIRTLMTAFTLNWEGAPYSQFEMTARLKERGVLDPIVYCPDDGPLRKAYEDKGIPVRVFSHPLKGVSTPEEYDRAIQAFARTIQEWKVDLVYANTLKTFYAIDAARQANLPSLWNPRESEPWQTYFSDFATPIAHRALRCFQYPYRVIFVSEATRRGCEALNSRHNFTTIHNGLDLRRLEAAQRSWPTPEARKKLEVPDSKLMVLLLGTVCERKGQLDLVEAIGLLGEAEVARACFFIVGDRPGPYSDRVRAAVRDLPAWKREAVRIVPETPEPFLYLSAADAFVCTSRIESFPRVILEAMAFGLPIVTTPVFGISEQVQENVNAFFYPPGDARTLAAKLEMLLRDSERRAAMGVNSRAVLQTLTDFDEMVAAYAELFREAWLTESARPCAESSA